MIEFHQQTIAFLLLLGFAVAGTISDVRNRRLPNWLCLATAITGLGSSIFLLEYGDPIWVFPAHGAASLVVGMALFALRWIGGGDAKFYAAVACWFPLRLAMLLLVSVTLSGVLLLILFFAIRRFRGLPISRKDGASLPYGVAIGTGGLVALAGYHCL